MANAEEMGRNLRTISISEFFEKNRHLLGYDNKAKAMLMLVKEGVDNSLDACEEAGILPDIFVKIREMGPEKYEITIRDNGPGIVKEQIPKIFGKLLYGSKFHRLRQSRGQQGLGISCAVLYSQLTTGTPTTITSSTGDGKTHMYQIKIDVAKNNPLVVETDVEEGRVWHGVEAKMTAECTYRENKQSVMEYIRQTAISNPYAEIIFEQPSGERLDFKRGVDKLPRQPMEIKPHLYGVELGVLTRMLAYTEARTLQTFLTTEFSRVGKQSAAEIILKAGITREEAGRTAADTRYKPKKVTDEQAARIIEAVKKVKLIRPPTECLSPLGSELIEPGMVKELNPEFVTAVTRPPEVYRGWPFQVEVGLAYGGSIKSTDILRFANRVPLLYQGGICAITKSVQETDWRRYGIAMNKDGNDEPLVIFAHICSVWVPFTSESKEAIANYDIIVKEIKLALQEAARKLSVWLSGKRKSAMLTKKKSIFERYAGETATALSVINGIPAEKIRELILELIKNHWGELNGQDEPEQDEGEDTKSWEGSDEPAGEE